jgi:DNA-binding transcriptional MerR regulator
VKVHSAGVTDLLPIGAFSRATLISANTLRAYHESGLLEPAVVDPRTGYRGYRATQIGDAAAIRDLRALGVPLAEIREVLAARDPGVTRRILATHRGRMREQLERTERILDTLTGLLADPESVTRLTVTERTLPDTVALTVHAEVAPDGFVAFFDDAYPRIFDAVARAGAEPAGPPGALFPAEYRDEPVPVTAYVPVAGAGLPGAVILPGGRHAVATFVGPYPEMSAGYQALGGWLAGTGLALGGPVRERYLIGPGDGVPESEYRTEIGWPVRDIPFPED